MELLICINCKIVSTTALKHIYRKENAVAARQ